MICFENTYFSISVYVIVCDEFLWPKLWTELAEHEDINKVADGPAATGLQTVRDGGRQGGGEGSFMRVYGKREHG